MMLMFEFYAYVHRCGGPTAAESHTKSQHLNPLAYQEYFEQYVNLYFNTCLKLLDLVV